MSRKLLVEPFRSAEIRRKRTLGLFPEQLNGTAFTMSRKENYRSWLYRIRPSVLHGPFKQIKDGLWKSAPNVDVPATPMQLRWNPMPKLSKQKILLTA